MTITLQVLEQFVVVFSKNYLPLSSVKLKRAIVLLVTGKAEPLECMVSAYAKGVRTNHHLVW